MHSRPSSRPGGRWRRGTLLLLMLSALVSAMVSGCAALVVGGAAMGVAAAHDRRGYATFFDDQRIELDAGAALDAQPAIKGRARVSVTSYNYLVLLTGQARTEAVAAHVAGVVSELPKVRKVINQVTVGPDISFARASEDVLVTTRAKLALLEVNVAGFDPTRVKVVTEDGVVYLLGLVSVEEGDAAAEKIRFVPGVARVVKLFEYQQPKV
jgi:osmotically-inducible protein OsmY